MSVHASLPTWALAQHQPFRQAKGRVRREAKKLPFKAKWFAVRRINPTVLEVAVWNRSHFAPVFINRS